MPKSWNFLIVALLFGFFGLIILGFDILDRLTDVTKTITEEIDIANGKIETLESSLNELERTLIEIQAGAKRSNEIH